jgi:DNA-binding transcriptional regulator YiaG
VWPTPTPGATETAPAPEEGHRAGLWAAVGREKARPNEPEGGNTTGSGIWRVWRKEHPALEDEDAEKAGRVKRATEAMHATLGRAVRELRSRMKLSQLEMAALITKHGSATHPETVSKWERGVDGPSPAKRFALAKIASGASSEDLAELFRAPIIAWRLVGRVLPWEAE